MSKSEFSSFNNDRGSNGKFDPNRVCNYCQGKGHWKAECPVLKNKAKLSGGRGQVKPMALAAPIQIGSPFAQCPEQLQPPTSLCRSDSPDYYSDYSPFITEGYVSLVGSNVKVLVKILRDTGAMDSFILESVLPFSHKSDIGDSVLVRGMGLTTLSVPLHQMVLMSDLVQGEVVVGVRPALPVEGVHLILGNGLAGGRVWADGPPSPVVTPSPILPGESEDSAQRLPEVFTACAVTRTMSRATPEPELEPSSKKEDCTMPLLPLLGLSVLPFPVSLEDVAREQQVDPTLKELFDSALPAGEGISLARGYFIQNGLLVRKWVPHGESFVGDAMVQIVVPGKFRSLVLELSHDQSGHLGVRKTYDRILRFFLALFEEGGCHSCQNMSHLSADGETKSKHQTCTLASHSRHW